jgi:hypothetical protein
VVDGIDTGTNERGEKWDHLRTIDLDRDGDLDIVANTEEHHTADRKVIVGEVWFENPLFSPKEKTQRPTQ